MFKVVRKFKIKESCGGSYVVIFFYEKKPLVTLETTIDNFPIEQFYDIPLKNEIAFRLKNDIDLDKIGEYVVLKNQNDILPNDYDDHFNSEGFGV